jgi:hypothetical protein
VDVARCVNVQVNGAVINIAAIAMNSTLQCGRPKVHNGITALRGHTGQSPIQEAAKAWAK